MSHEAWVGKGFDVFIQTEDQSGVPKGKVRMQFHRKDGTVDREPVLMPSLKISDEAVADMKRIEIEIALSATRGRRTFLFD